MRRMQGEYRRHMRSGIRIPVVLRYSDQTLYTDTLNISASGMGLKHPDTTRFKTGEIIDVTLGDRPDLTVQATVAHVGPKHVGLQFHRPPMSDQELGRVYNCAPWWQRLWTMATRAAWRTGRRLAVFCANTLLRPLILKVVQPRFIFAAYGTERQASTYYSPFLARWMPFNLILGYIQHQDVRGLLVAPQYLEHELRGVPNKVRRYIDQLQQDFPTAGRIALVGRLPVFAMKAGVEMNSPLVEGSRGTRYMIWDIARTLREREIANPSDGIVVIGGGGRIGAAVSHDVAGLYSQVVAFDPRFQVEQEEHLGHSRILCTSNPERLKDHRLFIALSRHGDELLEWVDYIHAGSLIADDTHPCISFDGRERLTRHDITVEKTVLSHDEFSMWPRMPNWNNRDIPGCLVEALVLLNRPDLTDGDFADFCREAERLGFSGRLVKPLDE